MLIVCVENMVVSLEIIIICKLQKSTLCSYLVRVRQGWISRFIAEIVPGKYDVILNQATSLKLHNKALR